MHYRWLEKWGRFFTATDNFCWWCEVLSTEMRSFFGEPKVNQKNSSFQCEALHRTSKSWSGAVKIWRTLKGTKYNALLKPNYTKLSWLNPKILQLTNNSFFVVCWQTMKINQVTEKQFETKNSKGEWTLSRTRLAWWLVETAALVRPRSGWGGSRDQPPGQSSPWQGPRAFTIFGRDFVVRIPDFFSWSVNRPQVIFLVFEA